jgi:hypothetical protein
MADFGNLEPGSQANNNPLYLLQIRTNPEDSIANFALILDANNGNYHTAIYFSLNLYGVTSIKETPKFTLSGKDLPQIECLPNPFTKTTFIRFSSPVSLLTRSCLKIYDITGKLVYRCPLSVVRSPIVWDGTDKTGKPVPKGIYLITLFDTENRIKISQKLIRLE